MIVLVSLIAIVVGLLVTLMLARFLYRFSVKKGLLQSRKDCLINAVIVAFIFFCVSSVVYVFLLNFS